MTGRRSHQTRSETETARVAEGLASRLADGGTVLLYGALGVGKTAFVRGLVAGAGGDPDQVSSPTFTVIQEYTGRVPVQHVDLYRLQPAEVEDLGLEELGAGRTLMAIEWADRLPWEIPGAVRVVIEDRGGDDRAIAIEGESGVG